MRGIAISLALTSAMVLLLTSNHPTSELATHTTAISDAVSDAVGVLSMRFQRGLSGLRRHVSGAQSTPNANTRNRHHSQASAAAWTGRVPPLTVDAQAQLDACGDGALYTAPGCTALCVAWSNATLRTPKRDHALYTRAQGRVSCHACPNHPARSNTLFDAVVEANVRLHRQHAHDTDTPQRHRPLWGRVLDAGTGADSLLWALSLDQKDVVTLDSPLNNDPVDVTAVTASVEMQRTTRQALHDYQERETANPRWREDETVHLVHGQWLNPSLLTRPVQPREPVAEIQDNLIRALTHNCDESVDATTGAPATTKAVEYEKYDSILADYLIGAVDGFTPFHQHTILPRLARHMARGSRMFVLGMEPYPDVASTPGGELVIRVAALRDACILLAGQRPYREYPLEWIEDHLRLANLTVRESTVFPVVYGARKLVSQLQVCEYKLQLMSKSAVWCCCC